MYEAMPRRRSSRVVAKEVRAIVCCCRFLAFSTADGRALSPGFPNTRRCK